MPKLPNPFTTVCRRLHRACLCLYLRFRLWEARKDANGLEAVLAKIIGVVSPAYAQVLRDQLAVTRGYITATDKRLRALKGKP